MRKLLLVLLLQMGMSILHAQNFKFGKVSKEELQETANPLDSSANATMLYRKVDVKYIYNSSVGFIKQKNVHERIKIYNKKGDKWATKRIKLYSRSSGSKEELTGLKGYTYNFSEGNVEKEKLKKDGVFEEKKNDYWKYTSFTLPNVNSGSVVEYKYTIESPYIQIDDINFQELIPVKKLDLRISIPEYFRFNKILNPRASYIPKLKEIKANRVVKIDSKEREGHAGQVKTKFSSSEWNFVENVTEADLINIPALKDEQFVDNLDNYRAKLILEYASHKGSNGQIENYATDWNSVTKTIYEHKFFGDQLSKTNYFKDDIDVLLQSNLTNKDKVIKVFEYIKSKVKWNNMYGVYSDKGVKNAYKEGEGSVADINLMLIAMLRYAGLKPNPILVSTKSNGVPLFPTKKGFNYVICGVEVNNEVLLLDATEKYTTKNLLPERVLNWQGRIIREHGSSAWVNLFPKRNSVNTTMVSTTLSNDLIFTGKVRNQITDYYAYNYRNKNTGVINEDLVKRISKDKGEIEIKNLNVKNDRELGKPIQKTYEFVYEDGVEEIGADVYISPMLFLTEEDNIFNKETRNYPIDFSFPRTNKSIVNINIPDGYRVKSIPESTKLILSDNLGEYNFLVKQRGNVVQISEVLKINFSMIPVTHYSDFKEVYKGLIKKNSEKIVLEKI